MSSKLNPYINFKDSTRSAMEFYRSVLGGELVVNTFGDFQAGHDPADQDLVMHSQLETPGGFTLMCADTPSFMEYSPGASISVSLSGDDEAELRGYWDGLTDGATIVAPLDKAPWGDTFGMLVDKFGINWLVNIAGAPA
jgi:PhnB protein